jgi:hypothetical protein
MQAFVHAASLALWSASADASGPEDGPISAPPPAQVAGHWQVHVEGQSESTVQGAVCCAAHVFHEIPKQY